MPSLPLDLRNLPSVLSQATALPLSGRNSHLQLPGAKCVQRLHLKLDGDSVTLSTWPAELQPQARAFYRDPSRVARVLDLTASGPWTARPNGHLSYWLAAPERRWYFVGGTLDAAQYMHQWQKDLHAVHSYRRDTVTSELWPWLLRRGYVRERDRVLMEEFLDRVPRPDVHLRPGVWISRRWSIADVQELHERGRFARAVREAVATLLETLGEPPLGSQP